MHNKDEEKLISLDWEWIDQSNFESNQSYKLLFIFSSLQDKDFKKGPLFQAHLNPKAVVLTSLEPYQTYGIDRAYSGQTFFWAYPPVDQDVISFTFEVPLIIGRYVNLI